MPLTWSEKDQVQPPSPVGDLVAPGEPHVYCCVSPWKSYRQKKRNVIHEELGENEVAIFQTSAMEVGSGEGNIYANMCTPQDTILDRHANSATSNRDRKASGWMID